VTGPDPAPPGSDAAVPADDIEQLYDWAPCGYLSMTPGGVVVTVNRTFLTWTGLAREDLVGVRRFADLLTAGGRIYYETHLDPMLHGQGSAREVALEVVRAEGEVLPVLVNAVLERDQDGAPLVVRVAVFDATERRQYERELLRARRLAEEAEARAVELARTLQQTLVPPRPPEVPGLELAAVYRPAGSGAEVGGDFYDVFQVDEDTWVAVLGDVSGKGVEAAVVTSLIRYTVRAIAVRITDPSDVLRDLNRVVLDHETTHFCTLALLQLVRIDDGWQVAESLAGHPPALVRTPDGTVHLFGSPGSLVGAFDEVEFTTTRRFLGPGETLVLYTDGVIDAANDGEHFGEDGLRARIEASSPSPTALAQELVDEVVEFQHGSPRDDIAVLALSVPG
jgi:sigma-B regulation protein RsbU (phosphoserine phosphatase)